MTNLSKKKCNACKENRPPLTSQELASLSAELGESWKIVNEHHLEKAFTFKNFESALEFTNQVGALAEKEGHHPDIHLSWGQVRIVLWTHKMNGLSEADFILAAKIDLI